MEYKRGEVAQPLVDDSPEPQPGARNGAGPMIAIQGSVILKLNWASLKTKARIHLVKRLDLGKKTVFLTLVKTGCRETSPLRMAGLFTLLRSRLKRPNSGIRVRPAGDSTNEKLARSRNFSPRICLCKTLPSRVPFPGETRFDSAERRIVTLRDRDETSFGGIQTKPAPPSSALKRYRFWWRKSQYRASASQILSAARFALKEWLFTRMENARVRWERVRI